MVLNFSVILKIYNESGSEISTQAVFNLPKKIGGFDHDCGVHKNPELHIKGSNFFHKYLEI